MPHGSLRGVYVSSFTVNGHHWIYSVNSTGEQVQLRTAIPETIDAVVADLWADLDRIDPNPDGGAALRRLRAV